MPIKYNEVKGSYLKMLKQLKAETFELSEGRLYVELIRKLRNDTVNDEELEMLEDLYEWYRDDY